MGCGSSASASGGSTDKLHGSVLKENNNKNKKVNNINSQNKENVISEKDSYDSENRPDSRSTYRDSGIDSAKTSDGRRVRAGGEFPSPQTTEVPKPVAFDIVIDTSTQDSIIRKHPPKRLQVLQPKETPLTADMLAERQRLTEERRREELQKRAKSARRTSKRRKEIMAAREYEKEQQEQQSKQLSDKLTSADKQRTRAQNEKVVKQKLREERARQARERAKRLNQANNEELNYEVEKDDTFNADDDVDSWLDGYNGNEESNVGSAVSSTSERIYDGRSSPVKRYNPLTSAETRKRQLVPGSTDRGDDDPSDQANWASKSYNAYEETKPQDKFFDS